MSLALDSAQEKFDASTDFTVGLEEEFALLEPGTLALVSRFEELRDAALADDVLVDSIAGELIASEIEIRSGCADSFADAVTRQRERRLRLFALTEERGVALGATGTHPWADYREQRIIDTEHYRRLDAELGYVVWRNNTFSLHVHVGVRGLDRAVRVCDRLRGVLPLLLALSANSPWVDGRDSRLHSARTEIFTRVFPRCGIPEAFGGWPAFRDYLELLDRTRSIVEYTQLWWSVRPHLEFGTVEVRICDAQSTAAESEGLAGLMTACVAQAARDGDEGAPAPGFVGPPDAPGRVLDENLWRATRWGLDGRLIDLATGTEYPAAEALPRLLEWTAPVRGELGIDASLPELNGAQRQRRMIDAGAGMEEVYAASVGETRETYPVRDPEEVVAK
jgi:glutamate---cysteine ligase / carboxylate-amine ligase